MTDNKPTVIVLSCNYAIALSTVRSLGMAGYTVDLIASSHEKGLFNVAACSKYVRNFTEIISPKVQSGGNSELVEAILRHAEPGSQKAVLISTDDYTTAIMDQNRDVLNNHFIMPTIIGGGNGCLTEHMEKTLQTKFAEEAGLFVPKQWIVPLNHTVIIPEDMVYPCFCKPGKGTLGNQKETARCDDEASLLKHLEKMQRTFSDRSVLVQEFLEIDSEIDLCGVCLDQEVILPAIIRKLKTSAFMHGVTMVGELVPCDELGHLQEQVITLLQKFRYFGIFDIELNIVGDKIYFNEVNLHSGSPVFMYVLSGMNLPALFVNAASGNKHAPEENTVARFGQSFVFEEVAWADYLYGRMNRQELKNLFSSSNITILSNKNDPKPGHQLQKQVSVSNLKHLKKATKATIRRFLFKDLHPLITFARHVKQFLLGYPQTKACNRRNPASEKPRVVVAGRNSSSNLCMARALGQAGYEVECLRIYQRRPRLRAVFRRLKPERYSKYVKAYYACVSHASSRRICNALIRIADPNRKMLLIPCDDLVANVADEHYDELRAYYIMPNVNDTQGSISHLMNKEVQTELAKAAGLPIINSCRIRANNGILEIPSTVNYPCFIKPNISKDGLKIRMRRCDSEEELLAALTEFSAKKPVEMLVEDYIDIKQEYAMLGLSTKDCVIAPGFFVTEKGGHDSRRGIAMTGKVLPVSVEQQLIDEIIKFVGSLQFTGLFDVDLILSKDGKMYFTELNLRYGGSGYAITASGANLPGMFADYMLLGKPVDSDCKIADPGKRFISERVMLDEYISGYITKEEMKKHLKEVDIHFIMNNEDPAPYRYFSRFYFAADMARFVGHLKNKLADK